MPAVDAAASYGTDPTGLIDGYVFSPGAPGRPVSSAEAEAWLRDGSRAPQEIIWLHFNAAHVGTNRWLRGHLDLADAFFDLLAEASGSPRIEQAYGSLVAVLNDVIYDFALPESRQVGTLWLSVDGHRLITVRHTPLRSLDRLRAAVKAGEQTNRSVFVLTAVTVLALPINVVAGLLGMNVGGIPLAHDPGGFWLVVSLVLAVTLAFAWLVFRSRGD